MTDYEKFPKHRRMAERALGRHLVAMYELNGDVPSVKRSESDMDTMALVTFSGVSRKRQFAVLSAMHGR